jgi:sugar diacid utilization regulator
MMCQRAVVRAEPDHARADDVSCHRNSVIYRLKQIEQLTGRSLNDPGTRCCSGWP